MKITPTILSIPPYLSTTWKNVLSMQVREEKGAPTLVILLQNNSLVEVPGLNKETINQIFEAHAQSEEATPPKSSEGPISFSLPLKSDGPIETLGPAMQHNPEQADLPPMPPEVLKKITMVARAFGLEDISALPPAEPSCNCVYCQVIRSFKGEEPAIMEEVTDEDLTFRTWDIEQKAEQLYSVSNPLDPNEQYNVFLGTPLGCTCGLKNCEHIRAVLSS